MAFKSSILASFFFVILCFSQTTACRCALEKIPEMFDNPSVTKILRVSVKLHVPAEGYYFVKVEDTFKRCPHKDYLKIYGGNPITCHTTWRVGGEYLVGLQRGDRAHFCTRNDDWRYVKDETKRFLDCKKQCCESLSVSSYTSMSDKELFNAAKTPKKIGLCYLQIGGGYCDIYVKGGGVSAANYRGWPRTTAGRGTGCVKAPDFPKKRRTCWYTDSSYALPKSTIASFCTNSGVANAAAQLRHALTNGACTSDCSQC